ncbi:PREDICTED: uncharacterized protein LOC107329977 [Acropora digitifera]|uniref:uncharacterized protein LOC107329977 n=1 Tax=Acropora digitifera TaxID=70779 RepID=UPI00077B1B86|nr:PREDICTED: uncharacterized protein LOC107329977 [Acropora digitifera]
MANTLCSFIPFPRDVRLLCIYDFIGVDWPLLRVLLFCKRFSKVVPDEIHLEICFSGFFFRPGPPIKVADMASLPNVRSLDFSDCDMNVNSAHKLFQSLPNFASLTELVLPDVPTKMTDWGIVAKALTTSRTLEKVKLTLFGERGKEWARALDAGLCAVLPLSSVDLRICGPMSETALQALENLLLNKSLSSVSVTVDGDMSYSLAVTLSRALTGQTTVKSLGLRVIGKLSFCCANLIERGIVKNNSLSNLVVSLHREVPDNWQAIVANLNVRLAEKTITSFEITPNALSPVTATQLTDVRPCVINYGFFKRLSVTQEVWGELTVDGAEALYNVLPCPWLYHLTLNIHGKLTDDFLHCTARHVDKQKPLCPITINTWDELTNEGKALLKELELDKNPAVTLNVCEVLVPSDESDDNEIESIDNPESLIALLESAENTGKKTLHITIDVQSDDSTCDYIDDSSCGDSDDSTGRSWNDNLLLSLSRNCSLTSLSLTMNNFSPRSTKLSFILISCLENFISLKSLTLTLNEYNYWKDTYASHLRKGLGRYSSLISLTLSLNIYTRPPIYSDFDFDDILDDDFDDISDEDVVPNISMDSFTLTINDFSGTRGDRVILDLINSVCGLKSGGLWPNYKSLNTFNLTLNNRDEVSVSTLLEFFDAVMKVNSLRILRLKLNHWPYTKYDLSKLEVKSPSLELIELTICRCGVVCSWLETLKWEKQ